MNDKQFEELVRDLQEESFAEARVTFGQRGFERWLRPRFNGPIEHPDGSARILGSCGDVIEIYLKFEAERISEASYVTNGCGASALCGSFTAELAHGKNPEELMELKPGDVLAAIGTFPAQNRHCATLAVMALHKALNEYLISRVPEHKWVISDNFSSC